MQLAHPAHMPTSRLVPFQGGDPENEAFQFRNDRGPVTIEHTVRSVCRPMELYFGRTGFGRLSVQLGCWPVFRGGESEPNPLSQAGTGVPSATPGRAPDDYTGADALHSAARDGRVDVVGRLIAAGHSVSTVDSFGFQPIHYLGWAQRPSERFIPSLEQAYVEILDTLIAHGAAVDAQVGSGRARVPHRRQDEHVGQTTLGFAVPGCADLLVDRLLTHGADPDVLDPRHGAGLAAAAGNGCTETVRLLSSAGADVELDPFRGGTPLEHISGASAFHRGHLETARVLVEAGANTENAARRLRSRLADRGPGPFGFYNRPMARRILEIL